MNELSGGFIAFGIVILWVSFLYWENNTTKAKQKRKEFNELEQQINETLEKGARILDKLAFSVRSGKEEQ